MDSPPATEHDPPDEQPRRYGRRLFLATVLGGVSSLYWGKAAWDHVTGVVSPVANAIAPILPSGGWRIYTISGDMPVFDPKTWRLKIGGHVEHPVSLTYDQLRALPKGRFRRVALVGVDREHAIADRRALVEFEPRVAPNDTEIARRDALA